MQDVARQPSPLALARFSRGLTQHQFAQRARVARETISRLERGTTPQLTTAQSIASALGLPVDEVFPKNDEGSGATGPLATTSAEQGRRGPE